MIITRRPTPALAPVAPVDGSPQQQILPLPGWATTGASAEVQALTVPGDQGPIAVFASLQLATVASLDVVVRLYGLIGSQRVLLDQGRLTWQLNPASTPAPDAMPFRRARLVASAAAPADSYEVTVQHLTPPIPTTPITAATGSIIVSARPWQGAAASDLIAQRVGRLVLEKDQVIAGGKYFNVVIDGTTLLRRFTLARTPVAVDAKVAHFWERAAGITTSPKFSLYVGNQTFVDVSFPSPVEFTNGLRVSFGKIESAAFVNPFDVGASGDDRMIFEVQ